MYHSIVKRIARKNFLRVNRKEFDPLLGDCVPARPPPLRRQPRAGRRAPRP